MEFKEIIYEKKNGVAKVKINRPERLNSFTALTLQEIYEAFEDAWLDKEVGVVVLTGVGEKAFSAGGDQKIKDDSGYVTGEAKFGLLDGHSKVINIIRSIPKPVIAAVNGYAIGAEGIEADSRRRHKVVGEGELVYGSCRIGGIPVASVGARGGIEQLAAEERRLAAGEHLAIAVLDGERV